MPIIAPGVCRYTVVGDYDGQDCMNIVDVHIANEDGPGSSREEVLFEVAGDILNNWTDHILPLLNDEYTARQVRWVDLNSAGGSTGSRTGTGTNTWPLPGENPGLGMPGNVYIKVVKVLQNKTRTERNGVLRLGGIAAAAIDPANPNSLTTTVVGEVNTGFENFKDGINGATLDETRNLCVVAGQDADISGHNVIEQYSCARTPGTLRRRMPGYGT